MSADEFRLWFQKNYLRVTAKAGSAASPNPGEGHDQNSKQQHPHSSVQACLLTLLHQLERKRID
jgi:hypothetical protein